MNTPTTPLVSQAVAEREVTFVPFGGVPEDSIRLSVGLIKSFIANRTKTGGVPSDEQCTKFVMLCKARRLNPWEGDAFLIGFDGKDGPEFSLVTAHQAFLKRAEVHPEFDGMESGVIVRTLKGEILELQGDFRLPEHTLIGGWAKVHFKTRKFPMYKRARLATFDKGYSRWKADPEGMIVKCVEADALRSAFPTMMGGMYLREEIEVESTVQPSRPSRLVPPPQKSVEDFNVVLQGAYQSPPAVPANQKAPAIVQPPTRRSKATLVEEYLPPAGDPEPEAGDPLADKEPDKPVDKPVDEPSLSTVAPVETSVDPGETVQNLRRALIDQNITEARMMQWAVERDLANSKQTLLSQLAGTKIKAMCEKFPDIVAEISLNI